MPLKSVKRIDQSPYRPHSVLVVIFGMLGCVLGNIGCASMQKYEDGVDFATRCSSPEVIRCEGFDKWEEVDPYVYPPAGQNIKRASVDHTIKASGAGALRFEILPFSRSDPSGNFTVNFADDFSIQFGEGEEFYIQWRQRFSSGLLNTYFHKGLGWKQAIISEGDREGFQSPGCNQLQIVVTNHRQKGFQKVYHSCGKFETLGYGDDYYPDEWMTFQLRVKIGTWYKKDGNLKGDSTVQMWVGREGRASKLFIDRTPEPASLLGMKIPGTGEGYDLVNTNPKAKYGKIILTPYHTMKSGTQEHPTVYTWYDELIISRGKIPDPL